jgi:hypothetical protein
MRTECVKTRRTTGFYLENRLWISWLIPAQFITKHWKRNDLVPQKHGGDNQWYKIVIMDHVGRSFSTFIADLKEKRPSMQKRNYARSKSLRSQLENDIETNERSDN